MTTKEFIAGERKFFQSGARRSVAERRRLLKSLLRTLQDNRRQILSALYDDLNKSEFEGLLTEFYPLVRSIKYMISHLSRLARPRRAAAGWFNWPGSGRVVPEPYGVTLIISTWNYPLLLALDPLVAAVGAGNSVVMKLAPQSAASTRMVARLLEECFAGEVVLVDSDLGLDEVLKQKFDYIFFTGGEKTGKAVAAAAAKNFTPVTLEMGGKSPCIVAESADLAVAARRIVWGKFLNGGQTCVAPDYLLVHRAIKPELMNSIRAAIAAFWGDNPRENKNYPRIINQERYQRLCELMEGGRLVTGGEKSPDRLFIAPTVLDGLTGSEPIMKEEIFGPVLPVLEYGSIEEAIAFVNKRPRPLALYYFGRNGREEVQVLSSTSSGGAAVNDVVMQLAAPGLPFGGVGASGMGAYHGKAGFDCFSHAKAVLYRWNRPDFKLRYPPFTKLKLAFMRFLCK